MFPIGNYVDKCFVLTLTNHANMSAFWYYDEESYVEFLLFLFVFFLFGMINKTQSLHPGRLTWNLQITHLERKMIFQASMIMFHVNLPGCKVCMIQLLQKIHFRTVDDLADLAFFHVGNVVPMSKICRDQGWLLLR